MNKLRDTLTHKGFLVILILLGLVLFSWHTIGMSEHVDALASYEYLFTVWAIIIFVLFLVSKSHQSLLGESGNGGGNGFDINQEERSGEGQPVNTEQEKDA